VEKILDSAQVVFSCSIDVPEQPRIISISFSMLTEISLFLKGALVVEEYIINSKKTPDYLRCFFVCHLPYNFPNFFKFCTSKQNLLPGMGFFI
jgi:hypothetical protein